MSLHGNGCRTELGCQGVMLGGREFAKFNSGTSHSCHVWERRREAFMRPSPRAEQRDRGQGSPVWFLSQWKFVKQAKAISSIPGPH